MVWVAAEVIDGSARFPHNAFGSLAIYLLAVRMRLSREEIEQRIGDITAEAEAEADVVALPTP